MRNTQFSFRNYNQSANSKKTIDKRFCTLAIVLDY